MRKTFLAIAVLSAIYGSGTAWAVLQETTVTITEKGKPLPSATIALTPVENPEPPRPKTTKTDDKGKIVLEYEDTVRQSRGSIDVSIVTEDGRSFTRRMPLIDLLSDVPIDVSIGDCVYLDRLTDAQLETLLRDSETRSRVAKLLDEFGLDHSARSKNIEKQKRDPDASRKQKKVSKRSHDSNNNRTRQHSQSEMSPEAARAIGTGVSIGIGIGGGRMGGMRQRGDDLRQGSGMHRGDGGGLR